MSESDPDFPNRPDLAAWARRFPNRRDFYKQVVALEKLRPPNQPIELLPPPPPPGQALAQLDAQRAQLLASQPPAVARGFDKIFEVLRDQVAREEAGLPPAPLAPPRRRPFQASARGYYWLVQPRSPWGDYGDLIIQGSATPEGFRDAGPMRLRRTGPFVPPITFPAMGSAVVTATLRHQLEAAGLHGLLFAPVIKERVIKADWRSWDQTRLPPELDRLAPGGEPEDILEGRHSRQAASAMEELWELVPRRFDQPPAGTDVLRMGGHVVVSKRTLDVLAKVADHWFETLPIEADPNEID